ncbi:FAD-dependent oxidoreductase [Nocardia sp. NBC_00511]|uniref:FAD-dependent oxidoreductase n=1 Tax=Nocardia sp. NBC_00511 TaxID=2903591 RepID=UPI0030E474BA
MAKRFSLDPDVDDASDGLETKPSPRIDPGQPESSPVRRLGIAGGPPLLEIRQPGRPMRRERLRGPVTVGRSHHGIRVTDPEVSREHLRLVPGPTGLSLVDLGSRNGTWVNGVRLSGRVTLAAGDLVQFGGTVIAVLYAPSADPDGPHEATPTTQTTNTTQAAHPTQTAGPHEVPRPTQAGWIALADALLGIDQTGLRNLFPTFTELPARIPRGLWRAVQIASVAIYLAIIVAMFLDPAVGLFAFFGIVVPLLPGLFLIAPGAWRNSCPLAAVNQIPRVRGFGLAKPPPAWLYSHGYLVSVALFFGIAGARLAGLDRNGVAAGIVLLAVLAAAFTGGVLFKGKSGWCSTICPLFALQRAYGQTPFATVRNAHCSPCVGCAKNCFDLRPRSAYQADLADPAASWTGPRRVFAAALPGFVLGFFVLNGHAGLGVVQSFSLLLLFMAVAVAVFFIVDASTRLGHAMLGVGSAAIALNIFYWFTGISLAHAISALMGADLSWMRWQVRVTVLLATVYWIARTRVVELQYSVHTGARSGPVTLPMPRPAGQRPPETSAATVVFDQSRAEVSAEPGSSLLEIAEKACERIESGCRMGVCGADPVAVLDGAAALTPAGPDELDTLRRLGLADNTRMACCARLDSGTVRVSLSPKPGRVITTAPTHFDRSIVSVVVVGSGIAGVTAADFIRRGHPDCEIHLVGQEPHGPYNRMGISRLVYGRSAMRGLSLLPETWYDEHGVTAWLNTLATGIDVSAREVQLATGQALPYDRLVLAMGARSSTPPIEGLWRPGCFALHEADDAMRIRSYVQQFGCRDAVIAGAGLLGVEIAAALHRLGLAVTVLERGDRLLSRHIDPRCAELLLDHLSALGIRVLRRAECLRVTGDPAVHAVELADAQRLDCDLFLTATGIAPNTDLARAAGIPVGRGILVDDRMRTGVPDVYAAGDVAEYRGQVVGLWPIAAEQGQVAAVNALGGDRSLAEVAPAAILKDVGLELFALGAVHPQPGGEVIVVDRPGSYRRLVMERGRIVGVTVLGRHPGDIAAAQHAIRTQLPVPVSARNALYGGDWSVLR